MQRRDILKLLGSVAIAAPNSTWGQTASRTYRVGLLTAIGPMTDTSPFGAPLLRGLAQHGYVQGRNVEFERRGAQGRLDRLPDFVKELVASKVDVIVTLGYPPALAAKQGTTLPIVSIAAGDPVAAGLVDSLARPGGNLTGVSDVAAELTVKRMEFLKEIAPGLRRVAMLWNATDVAMTLRYEASETAARAMGIVVQPLGVHGPEDFEQAFAAMNSQMPDAILVVSDWLTAPNTKRVIEFAAARRLPAIYEWDFVARDGGLLSYAMDRDDGLMRVASLVDRILKGANPADLPVEQPTRFRLAINLRTAAALGLTIPPILLARADEVIE